MMLCVSEYSTFEWAGFTGDLFARDVGGGVGHLRFLIIEEGKVLRGLVLWECC
ncbi:MAG: hypothetical protein JOZ19_07845 [Rubrobacter sp.]|nr:hypothetical protein [Rubrobacter sp.]